MSNDLLTDLPTAHAIGQAPDPLRRKATLAVCSAARDAPDARLLLDVLGLLGPSTDLRPRNAYGIATWRNK